MKLFQVPRRGTYGKKQTDNSIATINLIPRPNGSKNLCSICPYRKEICKGSEYLKPLTMPEMVQEFMFILSLQNRNMQQEFNYRVKK